MFRYARGLSLVELLVALAVGLVLMTGVMQLFLSSNQNYNTQQGLSRVQENGRLVMEFLARDLRMAGYAGCGTKTLFADGAGGATKYINTLDSDDAMYRYQESVEGVENVSGTVLDGAVTNALAGTDVLMIRHASGDALSVLSGTGDSDLLVEDTGASNCSTGSGRSGLCTGDVALIADCDKAMVFQVTDAPTAASGGVVVPFDGTATPGNGRMEAATPVNQYGAGAEVVKLETVAYYVATGASGRPGLFKKVGTNAAQEIVDNVENLQVQYGVSTDGDKEGVPEEFVTADDVSDWNEVVAVRIAVAVASAEDNVVEAPRALDMDGPASTDDHRLRQIFTTTVGLRSLHAVR